MPNKVSENVLYPGNKYASHYTSVRTVLMLNLMPLMFLTKKRNKLRVYHVIYFLLVTGVQAAILVRFMETISQEILTHNITC